MYSNNWLFDPKSISCPSDETKTFELMNVLLCHGTWLPFLIKPVVAALSRNPLPELGAGRILFRHEAVTKLYLVVTQLLKPYAPRLAYPPVETNIIECSNALLCHGTWLSFPLLPVFTALRKNTPTELGVGSVPSCYEAVAELFLVFTQLSEEVVPLRVISSLNISSFKSHFIKTWLVLVFALASSLLKPYAPRRACLPVETNTIECSDALLCHGTWLSFPLLPVFTALPRNPPAELGVGSVPSWHAAVADLCLVVTKLSEEVAPLRVMSSLKISSFKSRFIKTWLVLVFALASSLPCPPFGLLFVTLAHGECWCRWEARLRIDDK